MPIQNLCDHERQLAGTDIGIVLLGIFCLRSCLVCSCFLERLLANLGNEVLLVLFEQGVAVMSRVGCVFPEREGPIVLRLVFNMNVTTTGSFDVEASTDTSQLPTYAIDGEATGTLRLPGSGRSRLTLALSRPPSDDVGVERLLNVSKER